MNKLLWIALSIGLSSQLLSATSSLPLTSGKAIDGTVKQKEKKYYNITVPQNKSVRVNLTELEADVDLYIKKGNEVRVRFNDCYSSNSNTENEECIVTNEGETSTYSILVNGFKASAYNLKATVEGAEEIPTLSSDAIEDAVEQKEGKQYRLEGKKGEIIAVTLSDLTGNADLRVREGRKAGLHSFNCKSINRGTKTEECVITPKEDTTVYVHVYGRKASNYSLKAVKGSTTDNPCITKEELQTKIYNNEDVTKVNTSCITDMSELIVDHPTFNQDISSWDVSNVENMNNMLYNIPAFKNHDLSSWDVSKVFIKKNFMYEGNGNIAPKFKNIGTVLRNKAKESCQNTHHESRTLVCSDIGNLVYIVRNEHDIPISYKTFSETYVINIEPNHEKIKRIDSGEFTTLIKLHNTTLIGVQTHQPGQSEDETIQIFNELGESPIIKFFSRGGRTLKELKTIQNGSKLIFVYIENLYINSEKVFKDTYDISNTSNIKLISHVEQ